MLDSQEINSRSPSEWKRINMRSVDDLLGLEFIHDLYNRHDPRINSVRFRHTITIWKNGIVNSYAPVREWERLRELVGAQYYTLNSHVIEQTKKLYRRTRKHFYSFMRCLKKTDLASLSNSDLALLLINFQSVVLGELYVLNFVQIEHGLNSATRQVIGEIFSEKTKAEDVFVKLIQTEIPTASQKERRKLQMIAQKWKLLKMLSLYKEEKARKNVRKHWERYNNLYSAYGELPSKFEDFLVTFQEYSENKQLLPPMNIFPRLLTAEARTLLETLRSKKLDVLIPLLVQGGIFRDTNKALLGLSVKYRFAILDEIARRKLEIRDHLRLYLLSEIVELLRDAKKLDAREIKSRKKNGIVLTRMEDFQVGTQGIPFNVEEEGSKQKILHGQCASPGVCVGACKIVFTKEDAEKVKQGDIMVAIGTDFDLIEAMYRAAAVVTEEGGVLSHASVVCRELHKPCCIGVKGATRTLSNNQKLEVNATRGEVVILE